MLARTACLGNDVLTIAFPHLSRLHAQKNRIDRLGRILSEDRVSPRRVPFRSIFLMSRRDAWGLVIQQNQRLSVKSVPPRLIVIDSFSDLTDQFFTLTDSKAYFFANYSDIESAPIEAGAVESLGLLPLEFLLSTYEDFLSGVMRLWGPIPIVLLEYPMKLETRESFLERGSMIHEVFSKLNESWENVNFVQCSDDEVSPKPEESRTGVIFPYHYDSPVYESLARKIQKAFPGL